MMILKRAAVFVLMLAISIVLFPLLAFVLPDIGIPNLRNHLFFWPQFLLLPFGFVGLAIGDSQAFLNGPAMFLAIGFWLSCAWSCGYLMRDSRIRYIALATLPLAATVVLIFYSILAITGFSAYLDGP